MSLFHKHRWTVLDVDCYEAVKADGSTQRRTRILRACACGKFAVLDLKGYWQREALDRADEIAALERLAKR